MVASANAPSSTLAKDIPAIFLELIEIAEINPWISSEKNVLKEEKTVWIWIPPKAALLNSISFSSTSLGLWSESTVSIVPSKSPFNSAFWSAALRKGGFTLKLVSKFILLSKKILEKKV